MPEPSAHKYCPWIRWRAWDPEEWTKQPPEAISAPQAVRSRAPIALAKSSWSDLGTALADRCLPLALIPGASARRQRQAREVVIGVPSHNGQAFIFKSEAMQDLAGLRLERIAARCSYSSWTSPKRARIRSSSAARSGSSMAWCRASSSWCRSLPGRCRRSPHPARTGRASPLRPGGNSRSSAFSLLKPRRCRREAFLRTLPKD